MKYLALLLLIFCLVALVKAEYNITTVIRKGFGDGLPATQAIFTPEYISLGPNGELYIADYNNHVIRKVNANGTISTVAGVGTSGYIGDGGPATSARLYSPFGVAADTLGNIFIADMNNHVIRKVDTFGNISTVAGCGTSGFGGDNGPATSAFLHWPTNLKVAANGDLYIADYANSVIRKVSNGVITTIAGIGQSPGSTGNGGPATSAKLSNPTDLALDSSGNIYIADMSNHAIRKISSNGILTTIAGTLNNNGFTGDGGAATSAKLSSPYGVAVDSNTGTVYIADYGNNAIRKVSGGVITSIAGMGQNSGFTGDGGPAINSKVKYPAGIIVNSNGEVLVADTGNYRVRLIDQNGNINTIAGSGKDGVTVSALGLGNPGAIVDANGTLIFSDVNYIRMASSDGSVTTLATLSQPFANIFTGLYVHPLDSDILFVADTGSSVIKKFSLQYRNFTVIAGVPGNTALSGDGGLATNAKINRPTGVAMDSLGQIYIADSNNNVVRVILTSGNITTFAGTTSGFSGDGGLAKSARLNRPVAVVVDSNDNVLIADSNNHVIRKVDVNGIITTFAGTTSGYSGDGGLAKNAKLQSPGGLAIDSKDQVYISDTANHVIRKVTTDGKISTIAGVGTVYGYGGDGGPATSAYLYKPMGISVNSKGTIYFADSVNNVIRSLIQLDDCSALGDCNGHGSCSGSTCVCDSGWTGSSNCSLFSCDSSNNCNGNGQCVSNNTCTCNSGWMGNSSCSMISCDALNNCNGHGQCISNNTCSCNSGWMGNSNCSLFTCDSMNDCTGNGKCTGNNTCTCNSGWSSSNCSIFNCDALNNCNGHGQCISNNTCSCNSGWMGNSNCSLFTCDSMNDCTGNGKCTGNNTCTCNSGWSSSNCSIFNCDALNNCNGHGQCVSNNTCACNSGWKGNSSCSMISCETLNECNGNGICSTSNNCTCKSGWMGNSNCSLFTCDAINNCSGHGVCSGSNLCSCQKEWTGPSCSVKIFFGSFQSNQSDIQFQYVNGNSSTIRFDFDQVKITIPGNSSLNNYYVISSIVKTSDSFVSTLALQDFQGNIIQNVALDSVVAYSFSFNTSNDYNYTCVRYESNSWITGDVTTSVSSNSITCQTNYLTSMSIRSNLISSTVTPVQSVATSNQLKTDNTATILIAVLVPTLSVLLLSVIGITVTVILCKCCNKKSAKAAAKTTV